MKKLLALPVALPITMIAAPAFAHHPMGGEAPQTFAHGLLSGLAHPVIGVDHLAFVLLAGIAATVRGVGLAAPLAFIAATMAGTLLILAGVTLPGAELAIALSVVLLGALLVSGRDMARPVALAGFAAAGLFHGWAYGEAVIGSEPMPVAAYLLGFAAIQFAIAAAAAKATEAGMRAGYQPRIAAALLTGVGVAFMAEHVEHLILG
ncbi:MAG: HupE/UreJ family protein [Paracoccus sp. (in: a-proteobacteria)]|nr:HupE/UreJ family protein [Paracoccus sp. (in: a-proteobacteria)]